ncbi:MAG: hypothetical protein RMI79_06820 [Nitrososphaerota archaeon]|nr:hypothetical protein [Nitrososphaerota archaeon]
MDYREIMRKSLHIILSLILLLPFLLDYFKIYVDSAVFYSVLSILVLILNAIQIKRPLLRSEVKNFMQENREKFFKDIKNILPLKSQVTSHILDKIDEKIREVEELIDNQLSAMERDYEKRGGYVGLTYGVLGVTLSYFLFRRHAFYGVISIATLDSISTIVGGLKGTHKLPFTNKTFEGSLSGALLFFTILIIIGISPLDSLIITILATLVEAYAVEDNLLLPLVVSFVTSLIEGYF